MIGDHKAEFMFIKLTAIGVPVALLGLGIIVCLVQAMVFCLLSVVYIGMAIEHHDHSGALRSSFNRPGQPGPLL